MKWLSVRHWKIRGKVLFIVTVAILITTAVLGGFFVHQTVTGTREEIKTFKAEEMTRIQGNLKDLVNAAYTVVEKNHKLAATMEAIKETYGPYLKSQVDIPFSVMKREHEKLDLSLAATEDIKQSFIRGAQQNATAAIRAMRFGERGYFWINDTHPRMVMHPIVPELEGKDLTHFSKDGKVVTAEGTNTPFFQEMVRVCKESPTGDGFVGYRWPDPKDKNRWLLKLSYVRLFKPWGWIVGAGFYVEGLVQDAKERAKVMVGSMRYGDKGYFWINDTHPRMVMHPIVPELEGKDLTHFSKDGKVVTAEGTNTPFFQEMVRVCKESGAGFVAYRWPDPKDKERWRPKLSFVRLYKPWGWIVGSGVYLTDLEQSVAAKERKLRELVRKQLAVTFGIMIGVVALAVLLSLWMSRRFMAAPIQRSVAMLKDIAEGEGDLTNRLREDSRDEIGEMAGCFNTFVQKIQDLVREISAKSETLNSSSKNLSAVSEELSGSTEQMSARSNTVATAAEEMSTNLSAVAAAMEESSTNVNMVASATEEMTTTINEIAQSSERARGITGNAVAQAERVTAGMESLGKAAQEIDKVTETITEISEQTNLLALNATIEAARAGESGKGFAVVANEIKELARQTAHATDEIRAKIDGIQGSTQATVGEIRQISKVIGDIDQIVATIATAVEEQSATTREIAHNVAQASQGIGEVNENVAQSSRVATEITQDIAELNQASTEVSNSGAVLNASAVELSNLAQELRDLVGRFKV